MYCVWVATNHERWAVYDSQAAIKRQVKEIVDL